MAESGPGSRSVGGCTQGQENGPTVWPEASPLPLRGQGWDQPTVAWVGRVRVSCTRTVPIPQKSPAAGIAGWPHIRPRR